MPSKMDIIPDSLHQPDFADDSSYTKGYEVRLNRFHRYCTISMVFVLGLSLFVIMGWLLDIPLLTGAIFDFKATKTSSAVAFFFGGLSLLFLSRRKGVNYLYLGWFFAILVLFMGLFNLADYLLSAFSAQETYFLFFSSVKSRFLSSINFVLFGLALLFAGKYFKISQILAFIGGIIAFMGLFAYIFGSNTNYMVELFVQMAFFSALMHIFLCVGILNLNPDRGFMKIITAPHFGGYMARRLLPTIFITIFLLNLLSVWGERLDLFSDQFGEVILVTLSVVIFFVIITWSAWRLNKLDEDAQDANLKIKSMEIFYQNLVEGINEGLWVSDKDDKLYFMNRRMEEIAGVKSNDMLGVNVLEDLSDDNAGSLKKVYRKAKDSLKPVYYDSLKFETPFGRLSYQSGWIIPRVKDGKFLGAICSVIDDTQRHLAENALEASEKRYRLLIDSAQDIIIILDKEGVFQLVNPAAAKNVNLKSEDILGRNIMDIFPDKSEIMMNSINEVVSTKKSLKNELELDLPLDKRWYGIIIEPLVGDEGQVDAVQIIGRDINDIKIAERDVKQSLEDKEILLREIHHRVKNNMQIISSLLNLQRGYLKDAEADNLLQESQNRVKSMAMVHEKLYETPELSHIEVRDYIEKLIQNLFHSYRVQPGIKLELDVGEIMFDIDTAVPLGLLINELVSNSLKYAFNGREEGVISISLHKDDEQYILLVEDDGVGLPEDFNPDESTTLGLQLVNNLVRQLEGFIDVNSENGTKFSIIFHEQLYRRRD